MIATLIDKKNNKKKATLSTLCEDIDINTISVAIVAIYKIVMKGELLMMYMEIYVIATKNYITSKGGDKFEK